MKLIFHYNQSRSKNPLWLTHWIGLASSYYSRSNIMPDERTSILSNMSDMLDQQTMIQDGKELSCSIVNRRIENHELTIWSCDWKRVLFTVKFE